MVGLKGLDHSTWEFDTALAEPEIVEGMMVDGRNAKALAELLETEQAKKARLSAAEVVAVRLYTGVSSVLASSTCVLPLSHVSIPCVYPMHDLADKCIHICVYHCMSILHILPDMDQTLH